MDVGDIIKKKKEKRRENADNDIGSSTSQCEAERESNVDKDDVDVEKKKKKKKKEHETSGDGIELSACKIEPLRKDNVDGDVIKKKKKRRENGGNDIDSSIEQCEAGRKSNVNVHKDKRKKKNKKLQEDSGYIADQNNVVESDGHADKEKKSEDMQMNGEEVNGKKKKKRKRDKGGDDFTEVNNASDVEAGKDMDQTHEKMMENVENPRKKKKRKKNHSDDVTTENHTWKDTPKKVSFSDDVEVFSDDVEDFAAHKGLVRGKRFSPEEDMLIRKAVLSYIEFHQLGENGLDMILHSKSHPEIRCCWKEIGSALPWRPKESVYYRAHFIFERDDNRKWSPEELKLVRMFHEKHGSERKSKHGMLRENISWEAISDKLTTRTYALCCLKWYRQLASPLVAEGKWYDSDDYRLVNALYNLDACCIEDVDWDNLLEHRPGDICRKRWNQMVKHLRTYENKSFPEQVEVLSRRYCSDVLEAREIYGSKPIVD